MMGDSLSTAVLQRAMDGTWQREKAVSANIANHETPGYRALRVNFEDALRGAALRMRENAGSARDYMRGLESVKGANITVTEDHSYIERADLNNVNLESENIEMAKTQLQYQYLERQMTDTFNRLRYAVREGR